METKALCEVFAPKDVEWRIGRAGQKNGRIWATALAYVTNRAIMDRLDNVAGPRFWRNEYKEAPCGGVMCGISILFDGEWVTKWDGAENTSFEAVKGGLSGAMKRAAVQWGIGRYLYGLDETFVDVGDQGKYSNYQPANEKKNIPAFTWATPNLPAWALPNGCSQNGPSADVEGMEKIIGHREDALNAFLIKLGRVCAGQTWRDLSSEYICRVLASPEKFIKEVEGGIV